MYDELVAKIKKLRSSKKVLVVAISGHGGSGKSTLAERLCIEFGVANSQIVNFDNFHAKDYEQATGLFEMHDWDELFKLLNNIRKSDRLSYKTRDWRGTEGKVDVQTPNLVIVEGIRLIRPETKKLFDLTIWINCPLDVATKRAVDRNRQQGDSEAELALWKTKWVPEAKKYVEQIHPEQLADFIYTDFAD